jgi:hypothetical protein
MKAQKRYKKGFKAIALEFFGALDAPSLNLHFIFFKVDLLGNILEAGGPSKDSPAAEHRAAAEGLLLPFREEGHLQQTAYHHCLVLTVLVIFLFHISKPNNV